LTKVPPAIPALRGELGLTLVQSGLVATMFNVIGMASGMLAGVLGDRFGYKRLALAGLVILAVGGGLGAAAGGFTLLLVSRFLEGAGFILCVVSSPTLITAVTANARDRIKALGMWSAYMPTGGSIALLVAPLVLAAWGWRGLWAVLALATAACAVVFARVVPETPPGKTRSLRLVIESLKQKGYVAMALLFLFYVAQWTSILIWLPTFLVEQGLSAGAAAGAAAAMVVANIPGNLAAGVLLARGVPRGTIVVVSAVLAALCEVGMFSDGLPGALRMALVLAFSTVAGAMPGTIFSGLPVHAPSPRHIATGNGMALQASNLGQFLGPLAIAWMASHLGGWDAALWALLAFAAGAAACGVAIGRIEKRLCARG
jgi:MFS family permease